MLSQFTLWSFHIQVISFVAYSAIEFLQVFTYEIILIDKQFMAKKYLNLLMPRSIRIQTLNCKLQRKLLLNDTRVI